VGAQNVTLHHHTSFGPMCGLMGDLKNARNVVDQGKAILNTLQYPLLKCTLHFFRCPRKKKAWDSGLVDDLDRIYFPAFLLPNVGSLKVISGSIIEMGWGPIMHKPCASSYIQWNSVQ
jgi:hypothetical protein